MIKILARLIFAVLLYGCNQPGFPEESVYLYDHGAIVRADTTKKILALVFTGDEYANGGQHILQVLKREKVPASFFVTGKFCTNPEFSELLKSIVKSGHYLGAHSDQHLLYCAWENRDSLLVSEENFKLDLENNYRRLAEFGITLSDAHFFLPPYEWYNDSISAWTRAMGLQLINLSPGTLSFADYTLPDSSGYQTSHEILESIYNFENRNPHGLNGFFLLSHLGTHPLRTDKFHLLLEGLIEELKRGGYQFHRIDELIIKATL